MGESRYTWKGAKTFHPKQHAVSHKAPRPRIMGIVGDSDEIDITDDVASGGAEQLFTFGHNLEEKREYLYFESGEGDDVSAMMCGNTQYKVRIDLVTSTEETGDRCDIDRSSVIKIFF